MTFWETIWMYLTTPWDWLTWPLLIIAGIPFLIWGIVSAFGLLIGIDINSKMDVK